MTIVEFQGFKRKYTVVAPEDPGPNQLLFLHGSLQNGSVMRRFTNGTFDELAARTGTVVVYPDGVDRHFNDARGVLPVKARELGIDDVAFLQHVAATVQEEYGTQRTYACGYSNGGQMVIRLLFDAPGFLDGACIFASTMGSGANHAPSNPEGYKPTPILMMHGTADPLAPYEGGQAGLANSSRGEVTSALWTAQRFATMNGCSKAKVTRPFSDVSLHSWEGDSPVELWTMEGVGHVIPSGNGLDARLGPNTDSFIAAQVVEDFFGF